MQTNEIIFSIFFIIFGGFIINTLIDNIKKINRIGKVNKQRKNIIDFIFSDKRSFNEIDELLHHYNLVTWEDHEEALKKGIPLEQIYHKDLNGSWDYKG